MYAVESAFRLHLVHELGGDTLVEPSFRAGRRKAPKALAFGCRRRNHRWADPGLGRRRSRSVAACTLDPCRGWGRYPSACIRTQKEPFVPPAGTGAEYRSTRGVSSRLAVPVGARRQGTSRVSGRKRAGDPLLGLSMRWPLRQPMVRRLRAHVAEGWACWVPRRARQAYRPRSIRGERKAVGPSSTVAAADVPSDVWLQISGRRLEQSLCNLGNGSKTRMGPSCRCAVG